MNVVSKNNGLRRELFPHQSFNHSLVKDYYNGISKNEAERQISEMLGVVGDNNDGKDETNNKRGWQVGK